VQLDFGGSVDISNSWSVDLSTSSGSPISGSNIGYNGSLQPGASTGFGMQGAPGNLGTVTCMAE
jgi:hypothetical protein